MNVRECMNKIKEAVVSAQLGETITAYNWNEYFKNKNVVAFGLGKFFEDTHERLFKKWMLQCYVITILKSGEILITGKNVYLQMNCIK